MTQAEVEQAIRVIEDGLKELENIEVPANVKAAVKAKWEGSEKMVGMLYPAAQQKRDAQRLVRVGDVISVIQSLEAELVELEVTSLASLITTAALALTPAGRASSWLDTLSALVGSSSFVRRIFSDVSAGDIWAVVWDVLKNGLVALTASEIAAKIAKLAKIRAYYVSALRGEIGASPEIDIEGGATAPRDRLLLAGALPLAQTGRTRHVRMKASRKNP